jgi:hypothetical protein
MCTYIHRREEGRGRKTFNQKCASCPLPFTPFFSFVAESCAVRTVFTERGGRKRDEK